MRLAALVALATLAASVAASSGPLPEIKSGYWELKTWSKEGWGLVDPAEVAPDLPPTDVSQRCLTPELVVQEYQAVLAKPDPACQTTVEGHTSRRFSVVQKCTDQADGQTIETTVAHVAAYRWKTMFIDVNAVSTGGMFPASARARVQGRYLGECPVERGGFMGLPKG